VSFLSTSQLPAPGRSAKTWSVHFGAAYYHEYQPYERLAKDLELMVAAGFTVVRVGESTWASYEPEPGRISFDALRRVVDAAWGAGIKAIVGTPTYAVPPWMARLHPEVMAVDRQGRHLPYGARQNVDFSHPAFLFYAERLIRAMAAELGGHPGVVAWQVDNEIGAHELVNPHVLARFRQEVMEQLDGVEGVNEKWGLTYWSHRLSSPEDLWEPAGNTNPGYALEWSRFQARLATEFLAWQRDLLKGIVSPGQAVLHCVVSGYGGAWSSSRSISEALDKSACNIYVPLQRALELPEPPPGELGPLGTQWQADAGTWLALFKADMGYSTRGPKGERFYVTEAQATSIGGSATNVPPYPGQLRLMAHLLAVRGAELVEYWHWHTLHYGAETYWGGVLGHDLAPGRVYAEVAQLGAELRRLGPALEGLVPDADIGFLYSEESRWAMASQPPLSVEGTAEPDPSSYHRVFRRFYSAACDARLQVRIVHPGSDWSGLAVLVVPALYIASAALLERVVEHARGGAHVVLTFRSGYADEWARARWELAPGPLRGAAGFWYQEYTTLAAPVPLRTTDANGPALPEGALGEAWADGVVVESAEALWRYEHPFLGSFVALASRAVGEGRLSWVGTLPDRASAASLLSWAVSERGLSPAVAELGQLPASVRANTAVAAGGHRIWCVANHGWAPAAVSLTRPVEDLAGGEELSGTLELGPWESRLVGARSRG
jgi:beta-galactosidase